MRLFTAIMLAAPVQDAVREAVSQLRRQRSFDRAIKWVERSNLHFTLQFLGGVDAESGSRLVDAFASSSSHRPFAVALGAIGACPARGQPHVVSFSLREGAEQLMFLRQDVQTRLTPLGYRQDNRPYHPHLTVGRVRRGVSVPRRVLTEALETVVVPSASWIVDQVVLFESRLGAAEPSYRVLARIVLGG